VFPNRGLEMYITGLVLPNRGLVLSHGAAYKVLNTAQQGLASVKLWHGAVHLGLDDVTEAHGAAK